MIKNKIVMKTNEIGDYVSPICKDVLITPCKVLCDSDDPTEKVEEVEGEW